MEVKEQLAVQARTLLGHALTKSAPSQHRTWKLEAGSDASTKRNLQDLPQSVEGCCMLLIPAPKFYEASSGACKSWSSHQVPSSDRQRSHASMQPTCFRCHPCGLRMMALPQHDHFCYAAPAIEAFWLQPNEAREPGGQSALHDVKAGKVALMPLGK